MSAYHTLPKDPAMLLSFVNTMLRDNYESFDALAAALCADADEIAAKLQSIDYAYDASKNQFI